MGCGSSSSKKIGKADVTPPPANAFLPYYNLAALGGNEVFGPFLVLRSYAPESGGLQLSVLVVCTESAQAKLLGVPSISYWAESKSADVQGAGAAAAAAVAAVAAAAATVATAAGADATVAAMNPQGADASASGELLYAWRNWRFWRFSFKSMCGAVPTQLQYQINLVSEHTFTVTLPARSQHWNWAFYSCNGLDNPSNKDITGGLQPLWADLMSQHAEQPLHAMIGGGDQLYNDAVFEGPLLAGWDRTLTRADTQDKVAIPFTTEMQQEVEEFYFSHYCVHFSQPVYGQALASIPSVNMWDDHDIFDGWGSYPEDIQKAPVLQGIFAAAQLFYLLFQQHTRPELLQFDGFWSGSSVVHRFGESTAIVLPDTRTFRTTKQICPPAFYEDLRQRLMALPGSVRHVVLVLTVPLVWPKPDITKTVELLNNKVTRDKLITGLMGTTGVMQKLPMRFGQIEILDDLRDHWDAREHMQERDAFLKMIMALAEEKRFRFTLLSGDVHCAGYGMMHSRGDTSKAKVAFMGLPSEDARATDPRFIPQIVSSAIANAPPPTYVLEANAAAGATPVPWLEDCVARMVPLHRPFSMGLGREDLLRGERNWCQVSSRREADFDGGRVLLFSLRCEKELGTGRVNTYIVEVPPLRRG